MRDLATEPLSFDALIRARAEADPDRPLLAPAEEATPVTAAGYARLVETAAAFLADRGVGPGDRIAMWGQTSLAWAVWLGAAAWRGAALVALHPNLGPEDLETALRRSQPVWLIADGTGRGVDMGAVAAAVTGLDPADGHGRARQDGLRGLTVMPGGDGRLDLSAIIDAGSRAPAPCGDPEAPLNLQFTSGSTGRPKIVVLSHRSIVVNAALTARAAGIGDGDLIASPLPLVHAAGLSSGLVLSVAVGALWCSVHRFRPDVVLEQIERHRCSVLQMVPTMAAALADRVEATGTGTPSLRLGFIGGAPCPPALCRRAIEVFGLEHMAIVYGQTEFGPTISLTTGGEPEDLRLTSAGPPLPGVEARVVDPESGRERAAGEEGEILVRGPTLMSGYLGDAEATAATVTADGWLRTGDLGRIERGCLRVTARLKELIIRGGENVSPYEVEDALREADGIADLCVVPVPSEFWGEEICAVIVPHAGSAHDEAPLRARAEAVLPRHKRPDSYVFVDAFPTLPSGKVDRRAVRHAVVRKGGG